MPSARAPGAKDFISSGVIRMTGIALGRIGATTALASVARNPNTVRGDANSRDHSSDQTHDDVVVVLSLGRRQSRRKYWGPIMPPIRDDRNQSACLNLSQSKPWGSARSIGLIVPCATTMLRLILRR